MEKQKDLSLGIGCNLVGMHLVPDKQIIISFRERQREGMNLMEIREGNVEGSGRIKGKEELLGSNCNLEKKGTTSFKQDAGFGREVRFLPSRGQVVTTQPQTGWRCCLCSLPAVCIQSLWGLDEEQRHNCYQEKYLRRQDQMQVRLHSRLTKSLVPRKGWSQAENIFQNENTQVTRPVTSPPGRVGDMT